MMRVLLAVDGSEPAKRAVTWAAQRFGAVEGVRFVLVHVEQTPVEVWAAAPAAGLGSAHELELMREIQELAHARPAQVLREARGVLEELGIASDAIEEVVDKGTPAAKILEAADAQGVDLIVMGRRGLSRLSRLLLGSVSSGVVNAAKVPVVTVP